MHPLRIWLYTTLAIAIVVAVVFAEFLAGHGVSSRDAVTVAILVSILFLLPWTGVFIWALMRASDMDRLIDRTREIVERQDAQKITDREYHGEVDDLARAVEQVRVLLADERAWAVEQRLTMDNIAASLGEGLLAVDSAGRVVMRTADRADYGLRSLE